MQRRFGTCEEGMQGTGHYRQSCVGWRVRARLLSFGAGYDLIYLLLECQVWPCCGDLFDDVGIREHSVFLRRSADYKSAPSKGVAL